MPETDHPVAMQRLQPHDPFTMDWSAGAHNKVWPMRLLLHIGTAKTGTTSVQQWLYHNRDALNACGVFPSRSLGAPNNRRIAVLGRDPDMPDDGFKQFGINSPEDHAAFRRETTEKFRREVAAARKNGCKTFVISSEHLHARLISGRMVERVSELVAPEFDRVDVLCFLRPQVDLAVSRLSVSARSGSISVNRMNLEPQDPYYNYLDLWHRWTRHFDHVAFLPFKRHKDVVRTICDFLALDPERFEKPLRVNEKVDYRAAMLSAALRLPQFIAGKRNANKNAFLDEMPVEHPISISRAWALELQSGFVEGKRELVERCDTLRDDDLQISPEKYPEEGNFDAIFQKFEAADFARYAIVRLNAQLWIERAGNKLATTELELVRNQPDKAQTSLKEAERFLNNAAQAEIGATDEEIAAARTKLEALGEKLGKS
ncbi:MAG: hypothetical protein RID23_00685 [Roseovarius sp.]